jgi:hemerythrin-like metal-binding protein
LSIIEWDKKYSVNIRKIDKQHKQFISILNDIHDLRVQAKPEKIEKIIDDLILYIKHHFSTEEEYLTKHKYPDLKTHKSEHDKFIGKVCEYQKNYLIHKSLPIINLFNFVWDWFTSHILVIDKKYQLYFEQKD